MSVPQKAPREASDLLQQVVTDHHAALAMSDCSIMLLFVEADLDDNGNPKGPALKQHGYPVPATTKVNGLQDRVEGKADATIVIDWDNWRTLPADEQAALLDHYLERIELIEGKTDKIGRPKLKVRPCDWSISGFWSVARRQGKLAAEVKAFTELKNEFTQQLLFPQG